MNHFNFNFFRQDTLVQKHFRIKVNVVLPTIESGKHNDSTLEIREKQMIDDLDFLFLTKILLKYV